MTSEHLRDTTIEAYLDDELSPEARQAVEGHLATCSCCSTRIKMLHAVSDTVVETIPEACAFCPSVPFWNRLSARLASSSEPPKPHEFLTLLSPILLGTLGFTLSAAIWLVHTISFLLWLGMIPPLGPIFRQVAASQSASPRSPIVLSWLLQVAQTTIAQVEPMTATWPHGLLVVLRIGTVHAVLTTGLAIIVALFAVWAWSLPNLLAPKGGTEL